MQKENKTNTEDRRVYKILNYELTPYGVDCGICPRYVFKKGSYRCNRKLCRQTRFVRRNWKEYRSQQYK